MPIEAQYTTYYGVKLAHYTYTWAGNVYGGTNNDGMLLTEHPDYTLVSVPTTDTTQISFIYPRLVSSKAYLDGIAEGQFTLYNMSSSDATDVTAYTVYLKKTDDVPGNDTTLGYYTGSLVTDNSVPTEDYITLPFFIPITEQLIEKEEKLLLTISFTGGEDLVFCHDIYSSEYSYYDVMIKVPFAPEA